MKNKRIIFYVTRQYMKQNKKRTVTTWLGIAGIVILMTCIFVGKDTVFSYLEQVASLKSGDWHVCAYGADAEQYEQIRSLDYVGATAVSLDMGFSECLSSKKESKPYWLFKGYSEPCFDWLNITLASGRFPQSKGEVVISEDALIDGAGVKLGDTIRADCFKRYIVKKKSDSESVVFPFFHLTLRDGDKVEMPQAFPFYGENTSFEELHEPAGYQGEFTVVGTINAPDYETEDSAFYTAIAYVPNSLTGNQTGNVTLRLNLKKNTQNYQSDLTEIMNGNSEALDTNDLLLVFSANSSDSNLNVIVNFIVLFFAILILLISIILIYNVFNISFEERSRYLGMLSSVGATKRQKKSSVYYEALVLLILALPVGFLMGLGIVWTGMRLLRPYLLQMLDSVLATEYVSVQPKLEITLWNVLLIVAVAVFTVLISSYLPARRIGKIGPIESIRGNDAIHTKKMLRNQGSGRIKEMTGRMGAEYFFARKNLRLQRRKTKSIVRALSVFMLIVIVTAYGENAVTQMVYYRLVEDATFKTNIDCDYVLSEMSGHSDMYNAIKEDILAKPDEAEVREWYIGMFVGQIPGEVLSGEYWTAYRTIADESYPDPLTDEEFAKIKPEQEMVNICAVDEKTYQEIARKCNCDMEIAGNTETPSAIFYQNPEMTTDNLKFENYRAKRYRFFELERATDLQIGETFPVSVYNPKKDETEDFSLKMAGYATKESLKDYFTFHGEHVWIIVNDTTAEQLNQILSETGDPAMERELYIKLTSPDSALAQKLEKMIEETMSQEDSGEDFILSRRQGIINVETIAETINLLIDIIAVCFVIFASFVCLLNLFNSIRGRAEARNREMAMLRSVGMVQGQMNRMLFYENIGLLLRGFLWAVLFSVPMLYGLWRVLQAYFGRIKLDFPWYLYGIAILIAALSIMGTTWICYRTKRDENILEELRRETVS